MDPPGAIDGFIVIEYGFLPEPLLPSGYVPPANGSAPLRPTQNVAICRTSDEDGYYTVFCTCEWEYVIGEFNETIENAKRTPSAEFGQDVTGWKTLG